MHATRQVTTTPPLGNRGSAVSRLTRVIFSFPSVCLALLAVVILLISVKKVAEPDIWWHLRNAQYLLTNHHFPSFDTYSLTAAGAPWLNHEWLSELPYYLAFHYGRAARPAAGLLHRSIGDFRRCLLSFVPGRSRSQECDHSYAAGHSARTKSPSARACFCLAGCAWWRC